jgi:hypothetical protein
MFKNLRNRLKEWKKEYKQIKKYKYRSFYVEKNFDSLTYFHIKYILFNNVVIEYRRELWEGDYFIKTKRVLYSDFLKLVEGE